MSLVAPNYVTVDSDPPASTPPSDYFIVIGNQKEGELKTGP